MGNTKKFKNISDITDYLAEKKIIIMCGHYGAGKTNIAVNFSIKLKEQTGFVYTLADLDMVNPYFRSADNTQDLEKHGIDFIIPPFANTNFEGSALPREIYSVFDNKDKRAVIDVGGDGNGAVILGVLAEKIKRESYEMIYVANKYRKLTSDAASAVNIARAIEGKSKLKITSVINNSNIGSLTTGKEILDSIEYAQDISNLLDLPFLGTSSMTELDFSEEIVYNIFSIKNYTKKLF
jgi:MinD-like ATPase involved in chromosome partitioning or flagellar assembly